MAYRQLPSHSEEGFVLPQPPRGQRSRRTYLAHSPNDDGKGVAELLCEHLQAVADRAAAFATVFGAQEQAHAAGLLHDLGKYADQFQRRLIDPSEPGRDHWSVGACLMAAKFGNLGLIPGLATAGHHTGLHELPAARRNRGHSWANAVAKRLKADRERLTFTETDVHLLYDRYLADGLSEPQITSGITVTDQRAADMLDVRMLFSALVDADFLETEAHFNGDAQTPRCPRPEGPTLDFEHAIAVLYQHLDRIRRQFGDAPMASTREALFRQCLKAAARPTGLFSLCAPTGAGKTLAMLTFALHHAREHGLRRVILVMPFLNIIDQTVQVYGSIFSPAAGFDRHTLLEHHSMVDHEAGEMGGQRGDYAEALPRLLTENWDAPIVLTTNVQFFESLMAGRPSRCRKLHRLTRSVILFDEVQTLPVKLAVATLATLSRLADPQGPYGATVVFATATQPAFDTLDQRVRDLASPGWRPSEMVTEPELLYAAAAGRVRVSWRHQNAIDLEELASELMQLDRVLCIVNLKRHAAQLARSLAEEAVEGLLHLSTKMCPAHRATVLAAVSHSLASGLPVRLVTTQCVEAGVDLDFPIVYRALAPLEAIAQAAGRCNRHGAGRVGQVVVFKPLDERGLYPPGYREAVGATETFLARLALELDLGDVDVLNNPPKLRAYFQQLYDLSGRTTTEQDDEHELIEAIQAGDFGEVARLYRLIEQDSINVVVPYDADAFNNLCAQIQAADRLTPEFIRSWICRATRHAVSLIRPKADDTIWNHLEPIQLSRRRRLDNSEASWFFALSGLEYDILTGLSVPEDRVLIL